MAFITGLPTDGSTVHVELWWKSGGVWDSVKYSYTAATVASDPSISSPSNGATLSGATDVQLDGNGSPLCCDLGGLSLSGALGAATSERFRSRLMVAHSMWWKSRMGIRGQLCGGDGSFFSSPSNGATLSGAQPFIDQW